MAKKQPGLFDSFKGLWVRGHVDDTPPDHFSDCLNTTYVKGGVCSGDSTTLYNTIDNVVRTQLYKPLPPFTGTNIPRILALNSSGELWDLELNLIIHTDPTWIDFSLANFFGRAYISPHDGKVGLQNQNIWVYNGQGVAAGAFREAGGISPTVAIGAVVNTLGGNSGPGSYLVSYAFETISGYITPPAVPFVGFDLFFNTNSITLTVPVGDTNVVARWIVITKAFPAGFLGPIGGPYNVGLAEFAPLFFAARIGDNSTTSYVLNFFDEQLIDDASYLFTRLTRIPAGVGLMDYKGRLMTYGEYANPSIVRGSEIGEPESLSSTSGFFITDPSDSTGVRALVEFRNLLYLFKRHRGYVTEDNGLDPSTWNVVNFEKAIGTEQYGIGQVLDAKGSQSNGFIIASLGALYFFNGTVVEPELSFKIRDLWLTISETKFHLTQVAIDPDEKKLYVLVALGNSTDISHIIEGDYRDGLDPISIKWSLVQYNSLMKSILIYEDFSADIPLVVTRLARIDKIVTLHPNVPGTDDGDSLVTHFELAPLRFSRGISQFTRIRIRAMSGTVNSCHIDFSAKSEDDVLIVNPVSLTIPSNLPGREYTVPFNLVNEQCRLVVNCEEGDFFVVNYIQIDGKHLWDERPR